MKKRTRDSREKLSVYALLANVRGNVKGIFWGRLGIPFLYFSESERRHQPEGTPVIHKFTSPRHLLEKHAHIHGH